MNIEYPYWYFDSAISSEKCNEIINLAKKNGQISAYFLISLYYLTLGINSSNRL